jgi:hypothetical protein
MFLKYQNSPEAFNEYLFSAGGKIIQDIKYCNIKGPNNNKAPKFHMSKSCDSIYIQWLVNLQIKWILK